MSVTSTMSYNFADPSLVAPPSPSESNVSMEPLFTEQEDEFLRELVKRHGTKKWHIISAKMHNKTPRECRKRWRTYLHLCMNKSSWSAEEDLLLLKGHNVFGNRWTEIAKMVPGRTDNAVKNRYNALCKKRSHSSTKPMSATTSEPLDEGAVTRESKRAKKPTRAKDRDGSCSSNMPVALWGRHGLSIEIPREDENSCRCQHICNGGGSRKPLATMNSADCAHFHEVDMEEVMGWLLVRTPTPTFNGSRHSDSTVTSTSSPPTPPQGMLTNSFPYNCSPVTSFCNISSPMDADVEDLGPISTCGVGNHITLKEKEDLTCILKMDGPSTRPSMRNYLNEHVHTTFTLQAASKLVKPL